MMRCLTHHYDAENEQHERYLNHNSAECKWSKAYDSLVNYATIQVDKTADQKILHYVNTIVKNEEELTEKIVYVCFSAYTNNPINLGIMANTSEGKTYVATRVVDIFPKDDVIFIGKMSPTALIHQRGISVDQNGDPINDTIADLRSQLLSDIPKDQKERIKGEIASLLKTAKNLVVLSGKILVFAEPPDHRLWDILKPILSHDKYDTEYKTTQTDGSLEVKQTIIRGWPAVIFCSAKNEANDPIWKEVETRFDIASPNTTIAKYKEANRYTAKKRGIPSFAKSIFQNPKDEIEARKCVEQIRSNILRSYNNEENPLWNPFYDIIAESFPSDQGKNMRQCDRILAYCNVSTLIHTPSRATIQFTKNDGTIQQFPITHIEDIDKAISLMGTISTIPPEKLKFLRDIFETATAESVDKSTTTDKLAEKYRKVYGKEITPKQILENYLEHLESYGVIESSENQADRRQNRYHMASNPNTNNLKFIRDKIIEQSNNNNSLVSSGMDELEKYSTDVGKITKICDPDGNPLERNQIQTKIISSSKSNNDTEIQV